MFSGMVTFTASGPKEQTVTATIPNDMIALEDDELVNVHLSIVSPASGVSLGSVQTTVVTIVDDDCKFSIVRKCCFVWSVSRYVFCLGCLVLRAFFTELEVTVNEGEGTVKICVNKSLETISDVVFDLEYRNGSAIGNRKHYYYIHEPILITSHSYCQFTEGLDYSLENITVTIPADSFEGYFSVNIPDDARFEATKNFFITLSYSGPGNVIVDTRSSIEIIIIGLCNSYGCNKATRVSFCT